MSPIEIVATIAGLLSVYYTIRQHLWCWPTGLLMVTLYIFIFFDAKLYSDVLLQIIYVFMNIYGWIHWSRKSKKKELPVTLLSAHSRMLWILSGILATAALGTSMHAYTDASFPYLDAYITIASLIAQWFLATKNLESWVLWITVDIVAIPVYELKDLHLTAFLYVIFLVLAFSGLLEWNRSMKKSAA